MKNLKVCLGLTLVVLAVFMLSCGGGNSPKALAKETVELMAEALANPSKEEEIGRKLKAIEAKVEKMSTLNQLAYSAEYLKLMGEQGGDIFKSAFSGSETEAAFKEFGEHLNSPEVKESAGAINEAVNSQELQDSLKDALNAFGLGQ